MPFAASILLCLFNLAVSKLQQKAQTPKSASAQRITQRRKAEDSLAPLILHNPPHLLQPTLVQSRARVPVPDVRLDIEGRGGEALVRLLLERPERDVVRQTGEHLADAGREAEENGVSEVDARWGVRKERKKVSKCCRCFSRRT